MCVTVAFVEGEVENGLGGGGDRSLRMWVWTWACVVVMPRSASAVIPDHLKMKD